MIRGAGAAVLWLALGSVGGCATQRADSAAQVQAAFEHYCTLMRAMDHSGIAAMFSSDGEIANAGQAPIHGRMMINAFLAGFADYRVLTYTTDAVRTQISGEYARIDTVYHERVRLPDGRLVEVSGNLEALWHRSPRGRWYLTRMATRPLTPVSRLEPRERYPGSA